MKLFTSVLFAASILFSASAASAECLSTQEAYQRGQDFGKQVCQDAKYEFADQTVVFRSHIYSGDAPEFCDYYAILHCKAGFRNGYSSGRAEVIAGTYVPSCRSLYYRNIFMERAGERLQSLYRKAQHSACSSR